MAAEEYREEEEEHIEDDGEAIWLMSLADMMTLLFTFFVVMYASAVAEESMSGGLAESMAKSFGGEVQKPYEDLAEQLKKLIEELGLDGEIDVKSSMEGMIITFTSTVLFQSGSADISNKFSPAIKEIITKVRVAAPDDAIRVEGHTDDVPIRSRRYPSNWELSGARASTMIRLFEGVGFTKRKLTAIGYGETRPLHPNRSKGGQPIRENMAKNRRIVLKIMKDFRAKKKNRMIDEKDIEI